MKYFITDKEGNQIYESDTEKGIMYKWDLYIDDTVKIFNHYIEDEYGVEYNYCTDLYGTFFAPKEKLAI